MAVFDLQHPWVFTFGVLGNIISIFVYFAPMPTFIRIYKEKSTMGFHSLPYVVALFSAMLWLFYAFLKPNSVLLISINSFGCIIEIIYVSIYLFYATKKARTHTVKLLASMNMGLFCAIFFVSYFLFKDHRVQVVGWVCVAVSVCVFAAPLSIVYQVVKTRSVEFMPFPLSFFLTLSAVMWFAYGMLQKDFCVALPNVLGFLLGMIQMLLYGIFRNAKPIKADELPEHVSSIMTVGTPEVHPLDSDKYKNNNIAQTKPETVEVLFVDKEENKQESESEDSTEKCKNNINESRGSCGVEVEPASVNVQLEAPPPLQLIVCAA